MQRILVPIFIILGGEHFSLYFVSASDIFCTYDIIYLVASSHGYGPKSECEPREAEVWVTEPWTFGKETLQQSYELYMVDEIVHD